MPGKDLSLTHPPVFVGGLRRSGTTLMRKVLGSHGQLSFLSTELNFFEKFHDGAPLDGQRFDRILHELLDFLERKNCHLPQDGILERLGQADRSWKNLFIAILDENRAAQNKAICGEKSPLYEFHLPFFDEWFGVAGYRFIHVIRDPLANYASHRFSSRDLGLAHPLEWALAWNRSASIALINSRLRPQTHLYVLYDEFVKDTEASVTRICAFLGLEPQVERMLAMTDFAWQITDNSSFLERTSGHASYEGRIRRSDELDRAGLLDGGERAVIHRHCGPLASVLGYQGYDQYLYSPRNVPDLFSGDLLKSQLDRMGFMEYLSKVEVGYFWKRLVQGLKNMARLG